MIDPEKIYHVYPTNDLQEHHKECVFPVDGLPKCECLCNPSYREDEEGYLVIHNSFDGREHFEPDNKVRQN